MAELSGSDFIVRKYKELTDPRRQTESLLTQIQSAQRTLQGMRDEKQFNLQQKAGEQAYRQGEQAYQQEEEMFPLEKQKVKSETEQNWAQVGTLVSKALNAGSLTDENRRFYTKLVIDAWNDLHTTPWTGAPDQITEATSLLAQFNIPFKALFPGNAASIEIPMSSGVPDAKTRFLQLARSRMGMPVTPQGQTPTATTPVTPTPSATPPINIPESGFLMGSSQAPGIPMNKISELESYFAKSPEERLMVLYGDKADLSNKLQLAHLDMVNKGKADELKRTIAERDKQRGEKDKVKEYKIKSLDNDLDKLVASARAGTVTEKQAKALAVKLRNDYLKAGINKSNLVQIVLSAMKQVRSITEEDFDNASLLLHPVRQALVERTWHGLAKPKEEVNLSPDQMTALNKMLGSEYYKTSASATITLEKLQSIMDSAKAEAYPTSIYKWDTSEPRTEKGKQVAPVEKPMSTGKQVKPVESEKPAKSKIQIDFAVWGTPEGRASLIKQHNLSDDYVVWIDANYKQFRANLEKEIGTGR